MISDKNRSQKISTFKTDRNRTSIEIMQLSLAFRPFQVEIFQPVIQNCPKFTSKVTFDNDFSVVFSLVGMTDSILPEIRMSPAANGRGLCDIVYHIEQVLFRVTKSPVRNGEKRSYRYIFVVLELPIFFKRYLVTLNNTLSISHSPLLTFKDFRSFGTSNKLWTSF